MAIIGIIVTKSSEPALALPPSLFLDRGQLRRDMAALRKDIAALGERVGQVALGLVERIGKLESNLGERIARLEVATERFIKPQSTP